MDNPLHKTRDWSTWRDLFRVIGEAGASAGIVDPDPGKPSGFDWVSRPEWVREPPAEGIVQAGEVPSREEDHEDTATETLQVYEDAA